MITRKLSLLLLYGVKKWSICDLHPLQNVFVLHFALVRCSYSAYNQLGIRGVSWKPPGRRTRLWLFWRSFVKACWAWNRWNLWKITFVTTFTVKCNLKKIYLSAIYHTVYNAILPTPGRLMQVTTLSNRYLVVQVIKSSARIFFVK